MEEFELLSEAVWLSRVLGLNGDAEGSASFLHSSTHTHSWMNCTVDRSDFLSATVSSVILPQA